MSKTCPPCEKKLDDCFACSAGRCTILSKTDFGERGCPFYKTRSQTAEERRASRQRLMDLGLENLIEKYGGY